MLVRCSSRGRAEDHYSQVWVRASEGIWVAFETKGISNLHYFVNVNLLFFLKSNLNSIASFTVSM